MYPNLRAEMKRNRITNDVVAQRLGIHPSTLSSKLNQCWRLRLFEAKLIQQAFFPDCTLDYLFYEQEGEAGAK